MTTTKTKDEDNEHDGLFFPTTMRCETLMDVLQSEPTVLNLQSIVQFPNLKSDSFCLQDFCHALHTNQSIEVVKCNRHFTTGFNDTEWTDILTSIGKITNLHTLKFVDSGDTRLRRISIVDIIQILSTCKTLRCLELGKFWLLIGNEASRHLLATSIRQHGHLQRFAYAGCGPESRIYQCIASRLAPNEILASLASCPELESVSITNSPFCFPDYQADHLRDFLAQAKQLNELSLVTHCNNWVVLFNSLAARSGSSIPLRRLELVHCVVLNLLSARSIGDGPALGESFENIVAQLPNVGVKELSLHLWGGFFPQRLPSSGGALSVALADAVRGNESLQLLEIADGTLRCHPLRRTSFEAADFAVFADLLQDKPNLQIRFRVCVPEDDEIAKIELQNLHIESTLNGVGRGRLLARSDDVRNASEWVEAMERVQSKNVDDELVTLSCLYKLLLLRPTLCCDSRRHALDGT